MILCRLLVLAISLIVPLQGMTAITAAQCMALGHHQAPAAGHESHAHMAGVDEHDHAAHMQAGEQDGDNADAGAKKSQCSPCTACCASASIAAPLTPAILSESHDAAYLWPQLPTVGVLPHGLDRPPLAL
jgi:hypothetical protein